MSALYNYGEEELLDNMEETSADGENVTGKDEKAELLGQRMTMKTPQMRTKNRPRA